MILSFDFKVCPQTYSRFIAKNAGKLYLRNVLTVSGLDHDATRTYATIQGTAIILLMKELKEKKIMKIWR